MVVESEIFPNVLSSLRDPDDYVVKNVATLIREIAKHTPEVRRGGRERERERVRESHFECCIYSNRTNA